jgi:hypothetical protein
MVIMAFCSSIEWNILCYSEWEIKAAKLKKTMNYVFPCKKSYTEKKIVVMGASFITGSTNIRHNKHKLP